MSRSRFSFFFLMAISLLSIFGGCGGGVSGPPAAPTDASKVMVETRDLIIEASFGSMPFKKKADAKQYESKFPEAAKAIADGSVVVVWGKLIKEGVSTPEIIAYESSASSSGGWAVKEDAKLYKVPAAEISALGKARL